LHSKCHVICELSFEPSSGISQCEHFPCPSRSQNTSAPSYIQVADDVFECDNSYEIWQAAAYISYALCLLHPVFFHLHPPDTFRYPSLGVYIRCMTFPYIFSKLHVPLCSPGKFEIADPFPILVFVAVNMFQMFQS
jgi:hypothetical protein